PQNQQAVLHRRYFALQHSSCKNPPLRIGVYKRVKEIRKLRAAQRKLCDIFFTPGLIRKSRRASAISRNTGAHSPAFSWRKSFMVGYQGVSSRSSIQRQSGAKGSATHVGTPNAPAR